MTLENLPYIGEISAPPLVILNNPLFIYYVVITLIGRYLVKLANIKYKSENQAKEAIKNKKEHNEMRDSHKELKRVVFAIDANVKDNKEKLNKIGLDKATKRW